MIIPKDNAKDIVIATIKGVISEVPIVGGLFSEYIGLAQNKIADKRMAQWIGMVEEKLQYLEDEFETLTSNELFYSCIQIATVNAMRSYQEEKRLLFSNALYNTAKLDLDADKKLLFLSLLDRHTLAGIKLLRYYSQSHYYEKDYIHHNGMMTSYSIPETEHPIKTILHDNPEFNNDINYVKTLSEQLLGDSLIYLIDFGTPETPERAKRKRTTQFGDEFLKFITVNELSSD